MMGMSTSRFRLQCVVKIHTFCKTIVKSKAFNITMSELNYRNCVDDRQNLPNRSDCVDESVFSHHLHHCHFRYTCLYNCYS